MAQRIRGIADHDVHAFRTELFEARLVGRLADQRRGIELPVAGVEHGPQIRANDDAGRLRDRVCQRHQLQIEWPDVESASHLHDGDRQLHPVAVLHHFRGEHACRERRSKDRALELRPHVEDSADVVLMRMRQQEPCQRTLFGLDEPKVRQYDIYTRFVLVRERKAKVDHQPLPGFRRADAVQIGVHSNFAETAHGHEHELTATAGRGRLVHIRMILHSFALSGSRPRT